MGLSTLVVIPARAGATRLPDKPLALIAGAPMIVHVWRRAVAADVGPVVVATDDLRIAQTVAAAGGRAHLVTDFCRSGSDRAAKTAAALDPEKKFDVIVNVQGDEPLIDPAAIRAACALMEDEAVDLGTLACPMADIADMNDPSCVKMIATAIAPNRLRAHYFTRSVLYGSGQNFRHIGLYAWRRGALEAFAKLDRSPLELRENLEQLRMVENFRRIDAAMVAQAARGVDTPEDLARARAVMISMEHMERQ